MRTQRDFLKTKQFRAMVTTDDQQKVLYYELSKEPMIGPLVNKKLSYRRGLKGPVR